MHSTQPQSVMSSDRVVLQKYQCYTFPLGNKVINTSSASKEQPDILNGYLEVSLIDFT